MFENEIVLVWVAGNYTLTRMNIFGTVSRIKGKATLEEATKRATDTARLNNKSRIYRRIGAAKLYEIIEA